MPIALLCALALIFAVFAAGCGDESADTPVETYTVKVLGWKFAKRQPLGFTENFTVIVRNVDDKDIPQLAITVNGLRQFVKQTGAATNTRPIWIPNDVTYGDTTPNSTPLGTTFNLGPLAAGRFKEYVLPLTPIRRGTHTIGYSLAGSLDADAQVEFEDGSPAADEREVAIDPTPVFNERVFD